MISVADRADRDGIAQPTTLMVAGRPWGALPAQINSLRGVLGHPMNTGRPLAALWRWTLWQLTCLFTSQARAVNFVDNSRLLVARGMTGATQNIYCGLADYNEMAFVLHTLREDELFVDVGANVGVYSVLAAAAVGARAVAFEPQADVFESLLRNVRLNGIQSRVEAIHGAVGAEAGTLWLGTLQGPATGVAASDAERTVEVPAVTLDGVLAGRSAHMIKIDVEGFETLVLRGAQRTLANPSLRALLVEINGSDRRFGASGDNVERQLAAHGFRPVAYDPARRELTPIAEIKLTDCNTIFVRDVEATMARARSARRFSTVAGEI